MPIEVRELIIKAVVNSADERATSSSGSGAQPASKNSVNDGLDSLLELIKSKNER